MLFELLTDAEEHQEGAWTYYRRALDVTHTLASLDDIATTDELRAIGRFRAMLLERIAGATAGPDLAPTVPDSALGRVVRHAPASADGAGSTARGGHGRARRRWSGSTR